ncbi:hypothetical protein F4861DRAFT_515669 [Xylaria intraflava]|nr:hypothetical protein F4861DRAFT_515669 [Xylaria intraflava]
MERQTGREILFWLFAATRITSAAIVSPPCHGAIRLPFLANKGAGHEWSGSPILPGSGGRLKPRTRGRRVRSRRYLSSV